MIFGLKQYLIGGIIVLLLGGGFYAGCQIRTRQLERARLEEKVAKLNQKITEKDRLNEEQIHGMSDDALAGFLRNGGVRKP